MPKIIPTENNPYGLSIKQRLVIQEIVSNIKGGMSFNPTEAHLKYYGVKKRSTAAVMANENLNRPNFINALHKELEYEVSEKVVQVVTAGLYATQKINGEEVPDYPTRLKYIQEINKIARVY